LRARVAHCDPPARSSDRLVLCICTQGVQATITTGRLCITAKTAHTLTAPRRSAKGPTRSWTRYARPLRHTHTTKGAPPVVFGGRRAAGVGEGDLSRARLNRGHNSVSSARVVSGPTRRSHLSRFCLAGRRGKPLSKLMRVRTHAANHCAHLTVSTRPCLF
jgi:hypothetical protein